MFVWNYRVQESIKIDSIANIQIEINTPDFEPEFVVNNHRNIFCLIFTIKGSSFSSSASKNHYYYYYSMFFSVTFFFFFNLNTIFDEVLLNRRVAVWDTPTLARNYHFFV